MRSRFSARPIATAPNERWTSESGVWVRLRTELRRTGEENRYDCVVLEVFERPTPCGGWRRLRDRGGDQLLAYWTDGFVDESVTGTSMSTSKDIGLVWSPMIGSDESVVIIVECRVVNDSVQGNPRALLEFLGVRLGKVRSTSLRDGLGSGHVERRGRNDVGGRVAGSELVGTFRHGQVAIPVVVGQL